MIINEDNSFFPEEGEKFPLICPRCRYPKEYDENSPDPLQCDKCLESSPLSAWEDIKFGKVKVN